MHHILHLAMALYSNVHGMGYRGFTRSTLIPEWPLWAMGWNFLISILVISVLNKQAICSRTRAVIFCFFCMVERKCLSKRFVSAIHHISAKFNKHNASPIRQLMWNALHRFLKLMLITYELQKLGRHPHSNFWEVKSFVRYTVLLNWICSLWGLLLELTN